MRCPRCGVVGVVRFLPFVLDGVSHNSVTAEMSRLVRLLERQNHTLFGQLVTWKSEEVWLVCIMLSCSLEILYLQVYQLSQPLNSRCRRNPYLSGSFIILGIPGVNVEDFLCVIIDL